MEAEQPISAREAKQIVRRGYDAISHAYRSDTGDETTNYRIWIPALIDLLPKRARVLDLGCGNGVPSDRLLLDAGCRVTGVDISEVQIERARTLLPGGEFIVADMVEAEFETGAFDAVVSLFAIIHVPLEEQPSLFERIGSWLKPGGLLLASVGWRAWTGTEENWKGARMYWSHADESTYLRLLTGLGFEIHRTEFVPEGDGGHTLILAHKP